MSSDQCKRSERTSPPARRRACRAAWLTGLAGLAALSACGLRPRARTITVGALETAAAIEPRATRRAIVSDTAPLGGFYHPLGRRLGLFQIRSGDEWELLRRCAPELGPPPDLDDGIVIGLASHAGMPLDGTWPIEFEIVRVHDGAGFAIAHFQGGSFLPDGTTYLETAQIDGLATVLMVEVNGVRFYPE